MKKSKTRKRRGPRDETRKSLLVILAVVFVFLAGMLNSSRQLETRLAAYIDKAADLRERLEAEQTRTEEIDALKESMKTDSFVEEAAREKLGLVKSGEIVFREEASREE